MDFKLDFIKKNTNSFKNDCCHSSWKFTKYETCANIAQVSYFVHLMRMVQMYLIDKTLDHIMRMVGSNTKTYKRKRTFIPALFCYWRDLNPEYISIPQYVN